jgi:putative ABC transport system permease protein
MVRYLPLIWKNSLRNRRRSALTVLSIAASFCLLGVLMAMYHMFFFAPVPPDRALRLVVRNRTSLANTMPLSYRDQIRKVQDVCGVTVLQWFGGVYKDSRDTQNLFARLAVEPEPFLRIFSHYRMAEEQKRAFLHERTACVVGRALAQRLNFHLGDRITLVGDIFPVNLELTVRGIYDCDRDDENLFFNYEYMREGMPERRRDSIGMFSVLVSSPEAVPLVAERIDAVFRNAPQQTLTETEKSFELSFLSMLGDVKVFLLSVCGALTFTVLLVSANSMAMSVRERVREVGVLKTLGYTTGSVLGIILGEATVIACAGGAVGLALAGVIVAVMRKLPSVFVDLKSLALPPSVLAGAMFLAVLVGLGSSLVPAWNAARRSIVTSLRFTD